MNKLSFIYSSIISFFLIVLSVFFFFFDVLIYLAAMKFHVLIRDFCVGKPIKSKWRNQPGRKDCSNQFRFVLFFPIVLFFLLLCLRHLFFFEKTEGFVYFPSSNSSSNQPIYLTRNSIDTQTSLDNSKKKISSLVDENSNIILKKNKDLCSGRYIYIHDIPMRFNEDVLKDCQMLTRATDKSSMCTYVENSGFGPQIEISDALNLWKNNWFLTNQFLLEVIFHNRMKKYKCLTNDSSVASAVFVPYYAGQPEWKRMRGKDHFLISGRIAKDFRRKSNRMSEWGSNFRFLPESENMSMLTIESGSWKNDFAVPYPTYFHPSTDNEVFQWQELMRRQNRPYLFSFAGAPRSRQKGSIRSEIISQCQASKKLCNLLDCDSVDHKCDDPVNLMKLFQSSIFCLQPPGDSLTRRSTFDSILAGCIPVFFHPGSAYSQYVWHLPKNDTKYSVFISPKNLRQGKVSINQTLLQVSKDEESAKREEVIRLIPRIIYAHPPSSLETIEDAFDLSIKGILRRIERLRKVIS
ncbi:probable xyloglucan galactosyltransferase GT15 isoform X2 [Durio zibethinus]|uniref:Probable xyloglucan galactosyltransferase GT15 isoform X2 n=1 Tax=Durio zibethinus TaxID=66656 RepID=A0A6P6AAE1_DURZI|nr:probable xyloglucan galactosyltransferase GT15 isoform X2 [Durio zibethinus]